MPRCLLVARKVNLTGFSTGLTGWSKNLDPTGPSTRPVSISGADKWANNRNRLMNKDLNHAKTTELEVVKHLNVDLHGLHFRTCLFVFSSQNVP